MGVGCEKEVSIVVWNGMGYRRTAKYLGIVTIAILLYIRHILRNLEIPNLQNPSFDHLNSSPLYPLTHSTVFMYICIYCCICYPLELLYPFTRLIQDTSFLASFFTSSNNRLPSTPSF